MSRIFQSRFHFFSCSSRVIASMGLKRFHMHETVHAVFPSEFRAAAFTMLLKWEGEVVGHADIQGAIRGARQKCRRSRTWDIGCGSSRGHGVWVPAFAGTTLSVLQDLPPARPPYLSRGHGVWVPALAGPTPCGHRRSRTIALGAIMLWRNLRQPCLIKPPERAPALLPDEGAGTKRHTVFLQQTG
jgi:hypothetical protein